MIKIVGLFSALIALAAVMLGQTLTGITADTQNGALAANTGNLFSNGFETGDFTGWTKTDASSLLSVISSSGLSMCGSDVMKAVGNGSAQASVAKTVANQTSGYYRFWFRMDALNSANIFLWSTGNNAALRINTSNTLQLIGGAMVVTSSGGALSANTTYVIEVHILSAASSGGGELKVNGSSVGSDFTRNTSAWTQDTSTLGPSAGVLPNTKIFYFDQFDISNTGYVGTSCP